MTRIKAEPITIHSPGNVLSVTFTLDEGVPYYQIHRLGQPIIRNSRLGFTLKEHPDLNSNFKILTSKTRKQNKIWEQVWGEKQFIKDHHNELRVELLKMGSQDRSMTIVFRVFDDGVGFRYGFPAQKYLKQVEILDEKTEFTLTGNHKSWWIGAYQKNRFEYYTEETSINDVETVHTPFTLRTDNGIYISIHEAALVNYSTMTLEHTHGYTLKSNLVPWHDGVLVRSPVPMVTPWRTIRITDTAGDLITNYIDLNLNEPNKIEDTSWIKPTKYVGIWWEMHLAKSTMEPGPNHGATTENAKRYIDFAAEHGFEHVLIEGWNPGWEGDWSAKGVVFDFTTPYPDFDLEEVSRYARQKGIRLMGHHETSANVENYETQMEEAFALYHRLGISVVKTGYVGHGKEIFWTDINGSKNYEWHHGQHMVQHHQRVHEIALKNEISLNIHEGLKDTGLRRTWPNIMTREVAKGQEYNAWGKDGGNRPEHTVMLPFTRSLAGPFDYTPGLVDLLYKDYRLGNRVKSTLSKELALYIIIYSPLHMAADLPENYEAHPDPFQFIKAVPTDWYDTRVLHADIGNYVTIVRKDRNSDNWYLGSITNEEGRLLHASLGFLDSTRDYVARIYRDGPDADWESNPYDMDIIEEIVTSKTILPLRLATSGGQAIQFRPATEKDLNRING